MNRLVLIFCLGFIFSAQTLAEEVISINAAGIELLDLNEASNVESNDKEINDSYSILSFILFIFKWLSFFSYLAWRQLS